LRAWFYPGDNFGQEFVYPKRQGGELATRIGTNVPTAGNDQAVAVREEPVEPERAPVKRESPPEPLIAQAREPQPLSQPAPQQQARPELDQRPSPTPTATDDSLPQTAGPAPLWALFGLIALGSAFALRKTRRR
jgi:MYXO-CTERM domain-containing protein